MKFPLVIAVALAPWVVHGATVEAAVEETPVPIVEPTETAVDVAVTNSTTTSAATNATVGAVNGTTQSTILIIAADAPSALDASSGLNGYGIPFETLLVPSTGIDLPYLNSSSGANYGGIIVVSEVSYDYGADGYQSALTMDQWNTLYDYQLAYGIRMVQLDVYPGPLYGATALGGCCATGDEQLIYFSDTSSFSQAGLKIGAGVSTEGLYHYPATITDANTTEIAQFAANDDFSTVSTAAVISNFAGRQQMAFFISWATDWSPTSNFLQHAYITWLTRGLYAGYRRVNLDAQVDDMFLETDIYDPVNTTYRVTPADMTTIAAWVPAINAKMNTGSSYYPEIGHNGNGNIEQSEDLKGGERTCKPGSIEYADQIDTPLEFVKPPGTGTNQWPATPTTYNYTLACTELDPLAVWWMNTANRDQFMHITHTFTHLELDNATYSDALKEIQFNQAWLSQVGIAAGKFTSNGLIPPAITGLHNGDVLQAWHDAGLTHCVGDNTRPGLLNPDNDMWPLFTNVSADNYAGFQINGRWASRIYYNCDTPNCTVAEWIATSAGVGGFDELMATELADTTRHLYGLYHDAYMFHQANLRNTGVDEIVLNGVSTGFYSLYQLWVETMVAEFVRLSDWPIVTLKQADASAQFLARMNRDACGYNIAWASSNSQITGVTVTANGNACSEPIPITFPGTVADTQGFREEQIGNDPLTLWVTLSGSPVTFKLSSPVAL